MPIFITKADGTRELHNADKVNRSIERACVGLVDPISKVTQIATETNLTLYDGITTDEMDKATINAAVQNIEEDIKNNKLHSDMKTKFNLEILADTLSVECDEFFQYAGLDGLINRYLMKDTHQQPLETPQYFFMRIAMGLSYNEKNPTEYAKKFYSKMSRHEYIAGGSTNLAAGTTKPSLSNCFLLEIHDDMSHIA